MSWQLVSVICHRYQENAKVEAKILVPRRRVRALDNPLALVVRQPLIFSRFCQVEVALILGEPCRIYRIRAWMFQLKPLCSEVSSICPDDLIFQWNEPYELNLASTLAVGKQLGLKTSGSHPWRRGLYWTIVNSESKKFWCQKHVQMHKGIYIYIIDLGVPDFRIIPSTPRFWTDPCSPNPKGFIFGLRSRCSPQDM